MYVGHEAALSHLELALDVVDVHQLRSNRRILEAEPLQLFVLSYRTLAEPCHMPGCEISQCKWNTQHEGGEKHGGDLSVLPRIIKSWFPLCIGAAGVFSSYPICVRGLGERRLRALYCQIVGESSLSCRSTSAISIRSRRRSRPLQPATRARVN